MTHVALCESQSRIIRACWDLVVDARISVICIMGGVFSFYLLMNVLWLLEADHTFWIGGKSSFVHFGAPKHFSRVSDFKFVPQGSLRDLTVLELHGRHLRELLHGMERSSLLVANGTHLTPESGRGRPPTFPPLNQGNNTIIWTVQRWSSPRLFHHRS